MHTWYLLLLLAALIFLSLPEATLRHFRYVQYGPQFDV